jgi:FkbM family methyltransferase
MSSKILIQIGAAEGKDHVSEIILDKDDYFSILVEPNPNNFKVLTENYKNYKNIIFENIAISTKDGYLDLFVEHDGVSYHGSSNFYHLLMHGHKASNIKKITVESITLEHLLEKYNIKNKEIEYLFIDTEGHDCDIILSTNFSNMNIKNICFESYHTDGPKTQGKKFSDTIEYLNNFGYVVDNSKNIPWSTWVTKHK